VVESIDGPGWHAASTMVTRTVCACADVVCALLLGAAYQLRSTLAAACGRYNRGVDELQRPLRALFQAIAGHDRPRAAGLLAERPELARCATAIGATRAEPHQYWFEGIAHYAYAGDTALHLAAAAYAVDIAADLVAKAADVRARNRRGAEPLHYAADGGPGSPTWNPAAQLAVVELLIRAGGDPNAADNSGVAPLHRAVRTRCTAAVRALLEHGADVRRRNKGGSTALHLAVQNTGRGGSGSPQAREQQERIIGLLLQHGARPSDEDAKGKSVQACTTSDWVAALLRRGVTAGRD